MLKKTYTRKKELRFSMEYETESLNEIKDTVIEFAVNYQLKVTLTFAVNAAIAQYCTALNKLTENFTTVPVVHDDELYHKLIAPLPKISRKDLNVFVFRLDETIEQQLTNAISNFVSVSGQRLTKTAAVRTAIELYVKKLRFYIAGHQKGRTYNEEKVIHEIYP